MSEQLDLSDIGDLSPRQLEFAHQGVDYVLQEASADAAIKWQNAKMSCYKYSPETGNRVGVERLADTEAMLVAACLTTKADGKPVAISTVRSWPNRLQSKLFKETLRISDLWEKPSVLEQFVSALNTQKPPFGAKTFTDWIMGLDSATYADLQSMFKPTAEELAKNEQSATTASSS